MTTARDSRIAALEREERLRALVPLLKRVRGEVELKLLGSSMEPAIPDQSWMRVLCERPDLCNVGDVVVVQAGDRIVAHRVIHRGRRGTARDYVITRGDARWLADPPVPVASILGVVSGVSVDRQWKPPPAAVAGKSGWRARGTFAVLRSALELNVGLARSLAAVTTFARRLYLRIRAVVRAMLTRRAPHGD